MTAYGIGVLVFLIYALASLEPPRGLRVFALLTAVGSAAWVGGSLLGFIFGVPRFRVSDRGEGPQGSLNPNTNLEQISDWLTKIIVGATLVQLRELSAAIGALSVLIGAALGLPNRDGAIAAGAVLVYFFGTGFMWGYLWCSLRVFKEVAELLSAFTQKPHA